MNFNKRKSCIAAALVFSAIGASSAMAQTVVLGGGSSLVGPSITKEISDFGADTLALTYFITSSGTGQAAFLNDNPTTFNATLTGAVDYANSDAALSTTQITSYDNSTFATTDKGGPLIQIPYITTPITIAYVNGPTSTTDTFLGPQTTPNQTHSLALNDSDLCGIFSGKLTTWNAVTNPDTGSTFSSTAPITVVFRTDGSGTTDLLTRHLAAVCSTSNTATGVTFAETQTFTSNFPSGFPTGSTFVGKSGSSGVQGELEVLASQTTSGSPSGVAYISPDYTNTFLAPQSSSAAVNLSVASLVNSSIANSPLGTADVAPTYQQADKALLATATPPASSRTAAVQTNWVPNSANPTTGYPVSGTSQIILSECYASSSVASSLVNFLNDHYSNATYTSVVNGNGFDVPTAYVSAITADFLSNTSGFNLNINGSECTSGSGR
jgi:phosphate transport system substrate-binding protein